MSASSPPTPDDDRWSAGYVSSNGATPPVRGAALDKVTVLAYILAVAMPPVGLVFGLVAALRPARPGSRHWLGIIIVSVIAAGVWAIIIASGGLSTTGNDY